MCKFSCTATCCLKTFLFGYNIVLWQSGMFLTCAGFWLETNFYKYLGLDQAPEVPRSPPRVIMGIASLTMLVTIFSIRCTSEHKPVLLFTYGGFLVCISMMYLGLVVAIACNHDTFAKGLHEGLLNTIANENPNKPFHYTQSKYHCCGANNYTDWKELSPLHFIPPSCCQNLKSCVTANYRDVYQRGCYEVIIEYVKSNLNLLIGFAVGVVVFPLVGTALACALASCSKNNRQLSTDCHMDEG